MERRTAPSARIAEAIEVLLLDGLAEPDRLIEVGRLGAHSDQGGQTARLRSTITMNRGSMSSAKSCTWPGSTSSTWTSRAPNSWCSLAQDGCSELSPLHISGDQLWVRGSR